MSDRGIFLSIVIPVYNGGQHIQDTCSKIINYVKDLGHESEIIFIDDGSIDNTKEILREIANENSMVKLIKNKSNMGKGYSIREGILNAKGKYIIFLDSDLSLPIENLEVFLEKLNNGSPMVIGNRILEESSYIIKPKMLYYLNRRHLMSRIFNLLERLILDIPYKDIQCGIKGFRGGIVKKLLSNSRINRFSFDAELLYIAKKRSIDVVEVPVKYVYDDSSSTVNVLKSGPRMLFDIVKIRFNSYS